MTTRRLRRHDDTTTATHAMKEWNMQKCKECKGRSTDCLLTLNLRILSLHLNLFFFFQYFTSIYVILPPTLCYHELLLDANSCSCMSKLCLVKERRGEGRRERERERERERVRPRISGNPAVRVYTCGRSSHLVVTSQCTGPRQAALRLNC